MTMVPSQTVENEVVELEASLLEILAKPTITTTTTSATPATSTSSSPSLPSSTPPPDDVHFFFGHLNDDENYIIDDVIGTTPTSINSSAIQSSSSCCQVDDEQATIKSLWRVPASKKSLRTRNPIRAIIDPIMAAASTASSVKNCKGEGEIANQQDDDDDDDDGGKDQISLAVS